MDLASYLFIISLLAYSQGHYMIAEWPVRGKNKREKEHSYKAKESGFEFESFLQNSHSDFLLYLTALTSHRDQGHQSVAGHVAAL